MTRLTLHWHLRNIIEGVPDCEPVPVERDEFGVTKWEYPRDYASTGTGPYAKTNADVNVFYDKTLASHAYHANDSVAYLDAVAHDPCVPSDWRVDAEELLSHHIMERRLICLDENRGVMSEGFSDMRAAFINADLPSKSMQSDYWTPVSCPTCSESECLFDVTNPAEPNQCLTCGETINHPEYP